MTTSSPHAIRMSARARLTAAVAACALLSAPAFFSGPAARASAGPHRETSAALRAALRRDIRHYLTTRRTAEHISAVSLRITFPGARPAISLTAGTTRYHGRAPVSTGALWQIGSNTKALTAVLLLQLEAEGKLSISDRIGKWLPQYPAWRHVTIRQLLNMTSGIADYSAQPAFAAAITANPRTRFTAARLVSYAVGVPLATGWLYSNTNYILAQMIIEKVTRGSYARQLTRRIIRPLGLRTMCDAPYTCPRADAARMPAGYFYLLAAPPPLLGKQAPRLALTWAQGAGGIVSSLADMTTWDRAMYQARELPRRQQRQLESLVSQATGKPIRTTTLTDPLGFGLGVAQLTTRPTGTAWYYQGGTFGYRVVHFYFPRSGILIAIAANSATDINTNDDLPGTAIAVYRTLLKAGAAGRHAADGWRVAGAIQALSWMKSRTPTVILLERATD